MVIGNFVHMLSLIHKTFSSVRSTHTYHQQTQAISSLIIKSRNMRALLYEYGWSDLLESGYTGARVDGPHEQLSSLPLRQPATLLSGQDYLDVRPVFDLYRRRRMSKRQDIIVSIPSHHACRHKKGHQQTRPEERVIRERTPTLSNTIKKNTRYITGKANTFQALPPTKTAR